MPDDIKTDERLLRRLREVAGKQLTADELRKQRLSFIHGNLSKDSTVTLDDIEKILDQIEGEKVA